MNLEQIKQASLEAWNKFGKKPFTQHVATPLVNKVINPAKKIVTNIFKK